MHVSKAIEYILVFALVLVSGIGMGLGMSASQRHHELAIGLDTGVPSSCAATAQGKLLPQTGAVLIRTAAGELLGAVGASGGTGDDDEAICIAGIEAAHLSVG